ncbi:hypothetical protein D5266_03640 [bacterium c-19]|nr:hypothetical protein [bacterium c-19]
MAYEKAYGKWYWKHNQRMLATYLMIAATLIIVPQLMFPYDPQSSSIPLALSAYVVFALNLLMALLVPLYQFRFLFNKRSVDLYYPLPMKKTTMYWLNYGLGAILVCVPNMIFFINLLWEQASHAYIPYYLLMMAGLVLFGLSLYALVTFFVMKCNSLWDACFAAAAVPISQLLIVSAVNGLLRNAVTELVNNGGSAYEFFSLSYFEGAQPVMAGFQWISASLNAFFHISQSGGNFLTLWLQESTLNAWMLIYYLLLLIGFSDWACKTYVKRKGEDSEQQTTSKFIFPLFISLITGSLLAYNITDIAYLCFTIVLFFLMNALAERKLVIKTKMIAVLAIYGISLLGIHKVLIDTNGFGRIHEFYETDEILAVRSEYHDYTDSEESEMSSIIMYVFQKDPKLIEMMVKSHHESVTNNVKHNGEQALGELIIDYELKNGKHAYRYLYFYPEDAKLIKEFKDYIKEQNYAEDDVFIR